MTNFSLPPRFESKLSTDELLQGIVKITLSSFGEIYKDNKLFFFEEYTDHGIVHVENVIKSANNLITDETFNNILGSNDIGHFILAVLLHDIGMHLNLNGFKFLIDGGLDHVMVKELDRRTWSEMWYDYLITAKRFGGKTLRSIFGNENLVIRIPPLNSADEINGFDRKLIGEFLRRNHARLAHEIAIGGFPIRNGVIRFADALDFKTRNIIGTIARSHGVDLRRCLDYLETIYGRNSRRFPNNTHATYLMVLLRLADYIQIDRTRTSNTVIKTKTFASPISAMEHNAHMSISTIDDKYQDDPEKIFVEAYPKDSQMYLKIKKLISDIQYEFDVSWAVLGELYGRILNRPEIKYRRITSNLTEELFISSQKYVADSFAFRANREIIKLLIKPLYGDDPKYGVRELLQNAIDACREKTELEKKKTKSIYIASVNVEIVNRNGSFFFIISDNGIGMDLEVLKNYFLQAGASYRRSLEWQMDYLNEQGKSLVSRNGRFGIGILAAFIIGEKISVETRKIDSNLGYRFDADLNTDQINILKDSSLQEGTKITIKISEDVLKKFEPKEEKRTYGEVEWFDWFTLDTPSVKYFYLENEIISAGEKNPDVNEPLPKGWTAFDSNGFNKIFWKYSLARVRHVFCNGILIPTDYIPSQLLDLGLISNQPKIHILDYDGFLPLTLNRNNFADKLPFEQDIKKSLYKDYIAYLLTSKVSSVDGNLIILNNEKIAYPGTLNYYYPDEEDFSYGFNIYGSTRVGGLKGQLLERALVSKKGFIVDYNYFISKLKQIDVILVQSENLALEHESIELDIKNKFLHFSSSSLNTIQSYKSAIEAKVLDHTDDDTAISIGLYNSRIFLPDKQFAYLFDPKKKRTSADLRQRINVIYREGNWMGFNLDHGPDFIPGKGSENNLDTSQVLLERYGDHINFIREYKTTCPYEGDSVLNNLLERYLGNDVIIPFSMEERKKKYPLAFKELKIQMERHRNLV